MKLIYEGVNITRDVQIVSAVGTDVSGGRSDSLDLVLDQAAAWYRWKPRQDDRIELICDGYSTGIMFLNAIAPEGGRFRILATSAKTAARRKKSCSYEGKTMEDILKLCAGECGMEYRIYGLDGRMLYPYLQRREKGAAAFLEEFGAWEGAVLKTYSGRFTMIGIQEAQRLPAVETISISAKQEGVCYQRHDQERLRAITVCTPYCRVSASDTAAEKGYDRTISFLPARDPATAGRWARGMLLSQNRKAERLSIESDFHSAWTAMVRIDIAGETDANGSWVIDEAVHDFVNRKSRVTMLRCVETVV